MLQLQNNYDFKSELLVIHTPNLRDNSLKKEKDEFEFTDGIKIFVKEYTSDVVMTAVRDFEDYLFTSMGISALITKNIAGAQIHLSRGKDLGDAEGYMGYKITVTEEGITLLGHDERGIAQGLYYLEDLMNIRKAPFVKIGEVSRKALFTPRSTHSPFGMFEWNDHALSIIAHRGFDAIALWLKDPWTNNRGEWIDIRLIAERAKRFGVDVFVSFYAPHTAHPDDEGAQEFYDALYGELFKVCPIIKGVTLVGEATNFASRDPNVGLTPYTKNYVDNIPTGKISPGWYPCCDYPKWVAMILRSIRKYSDDAELLFCSYNWGFAPEEDRIKLIEALPEGITVLATWDMFQKFKTKTGDSVYDICDYSLSFEGPGDYFISEAKAVMNKKGIKMASISNSSGRTWDFGTVPYEPMPEQWIKRYKNMQRAHKELGLRALVENIHYGFYPSFIADLEKQAVFTPVEPLEETLLKLLERDFGKKNLKKVKAATELFSEAITYYVPTNEDQYGAFRTGPQYPMWSGDISGLPAGIPEGGRMPDRPHAMWGNSIYFGVYTADNEGRNSLPGVRIYDEMKSIKIMEELFTKGISVLESIPEPNEKLLKLILLAKFMRNSCITAINVKKHYIINQQLKVVGDKARASELIDEMEDIVLTEKQNVLDTIPIVQQDSRLGWEPSMDYTTDEKGLRWKLRQLDYELNTRIPTYRKANSLKV